VPGATPAPDGWLLDITESGDGRSVVLWVKGADGRVRRTAVDYRPPFLVAGPREELLRLVRRLRDDRAVESAALGVGRTSLFEARRHALVRVVPAVNPSRRALARAIDASGGYATFTLYDVDLGPPQLYYLAHGLYPFAPVAGSAPALVPTEPAETVDYEPPPLRVAGLEVRLVGERRGRIPPPDGRIGSVRLGDVTLDGPEEALLDALVRELARGDPDVLLTEGGDEFDLPWLYRRAEACGLAPAGFARSPAGSTSTGGTRSSTATPTSPVWSTPRGSPGSRCRRWRASRRGPASPRWRWPARSSSASTCRGRRTGPRGSGPARRSSPPTAAA